MSADEVVVDASLALKWVEREPYSDMDENIELTEQQFANYVMDE